MLVLYPLEIQEEGKIFLELSTVSLFRIFNQLFLHVVLSI